MGLEFSLQDALSLAIWPASIAIACGGAWLLRRPAAKPAIAKLEAIRAMAPEPERQSGEPA
jgi:hypothetical protein